MDLKALKLATFKQYHRSPATWVTKFLHSIIIILYFPKRFQVSEGTTDVQTSLLITATNIFASVCSRRKKSLVFQCCLCLKSAPTELVSAKLNFPNFLKIGSAPEPLNNTIQNSSKRLTQPCHYFFFLFLMRGAKILMSPFLSGQSFH